MFVRGATEAINLVAQSWGRPFSKPGDEVSDQRTRASLQYRAVAALARAARHPRWSWRRSTRPAGSIWPRFEARLSPRTRLVAITHIANATGAVVPVETIVELAHQAGAKVLIDGCQAAPRLPVDVQALGCDFYVFSGHKTYGPTGIGVL